MREFVLMIAPWVCTVLVSRLASLVSRIRAIRVPCPTTRSPRSGKALRCSVPGKFVYPMTISLPLFLGYGAARLFPRGEKSGNLHLSQSGWINHGVAQCSHNQTIL